jgi:hypothetical protein
MLTAALKRVNPDGKVIDSFRGKEERAKHLFALSSFSLD